MLTSMFILVLNNGESYEDKDHWNAGIFKDLQGAMDFAVMNMPQKSFYYTVEEWNVKGKVKDHYFEI